jgi:catechol 2,3-dioxygenase-like lactoylglutathione lyase family enzyme
MLKSIDHLILVVDDLPLSKIFYSDLFGFPPIWEGVHKGLGTRNAIFSFENMYLELLTKDGEGVGATFVDNHIKLNGEGLAGIALEVININKASLDFVEKGIEVGEYINGEGLSNSKEVRTWKSLYLSKELTRGIFTI